MNRHLTLFCGLLLAGVTAQAQALTGTVTVGGANSTYPSVTDAVTALQTNGVGTGGVTIAVRPGTYAQRIQLNNVTGSSATNRIRFVGRGGAVTLQPLGTSATNDAAVSITACDYVTLDSLNVVDGGTTAADQIEIGYLITGTATKGSTNITVSNCSIRLGGGTAQVSSTNVRGVSIASVATAASGANNNNRILNVLVDKAAVAVRMAGAANLAGLPTFPDQGNEVSGCIFGSRAAIGLGGGTGSSGSGIQAGSQRRMVLTNNRIDSVLVRNVSPVLPGNTSGISLDNASGRLENNRLGYIRFAGQGGTLAVGIRASIIAGDTLKVFNNFISGVQRVDFTAGTTDNSLYALGIWVFRQSGGGGLMQAFHNSIVMPAAPAPVAYSSAGFYLNGGSTGLFPAELRNNIIVNRLSTSAAAQNAIAVVDGNTTRGNLTSNNNLLLAPGTNGAVGQTGRELGGTRITSATLADWRTKSTYDPGSVSKPVSFVSEATGDLHLAGTSVGDRDLASPRLPSVLRDIDGAARALATYKGADEGAIVLRAAASQALLLGLEAYPNPVQNTLTLRYRQTAAGAARILVFDALGRNVRDITSAVHAAGQQQQAVDVSALAPGVYTLQITIPSADGSPVSAAARVSVVR
ncbi:T9SS type A sorting domain-containing protein [Hymenobacter koreensis]|uniref:Secretion system C-terminal sorting domain-containing protein n=1 Tax=Hymenobacter koreensis TaxID=1084523 RepID=A0ABP8JFU0_9BACT